MWSWPCRRPKPGSVPTPAPRFAPGTRIPFDTDLIARLSQDHRSLLRGLAAIRVALRAGRRQEVLARVRALHAELTRHLTDEAVLLYTYLEHSLGQSTPAGEAVRRMHVGMASVGGVVAGFLDAHSRRELESHELEGFSAEFESVAAALAARICREESSLYPLYRSPDSIRDTGPPGTP